MSKEANCKHRWVTYKSVIIGDYRKRYRKCKKCEAYDTLLVPMSFSYRKFESNTKVGIELVEQSTQAPTLE